MLVVAFVVLLCSLLSATAQQFVADTDSVSPVVSSALDDLPPAIYHYTRVLGGLDGRLLSPTLVQGPDGFLRVDNQDKTVLDRQYPIKNIKVHSEDVVEGIEVTYRLGNGNGTGNESDSSWTIMLGNEKVNPGIINLDPKEVLVGVWGRAGPQRRYEKAEKISYIGFVLFHTEEGRTRTMGPYGNRRNNGQGTPFWVSDVVALGGYHEPTADERALSGLFFIRDLNIHC